MKINNLGIEDVLIPFKQSFNHASAKRKTTESILVKVITDNSVVGYGEGCPRSYVTGETIQTANNFFEKHKNKILNINDLTDIKKYIDTNTKDINKNPAAFCATELALLDALGKSERKSIETLLSLAELSGNFQYTAVLGSNDIESFKNQLEKYIHTGFKDFKIKISGDLEEDKRKFQLLKKIETKLRVRIDANNFWKNSNDAIEYIEKLDYPLFAVEEPIQPDDYKGFHKLFNKLKLPIILDESFLRIEQFANVQNNAEQFIINIRISKMGGILRSMAIADKAKELGIPIIIGAQVGETSILTRAALTVANAYNESLLAQEGAFGTHLLENDLTKEPIMFGNNGILNSSSLSVTDGLGVVE